MATIQEKYPGIVMLECPECKGAHSRSAISVWEVDLIDIWMCLVCFNCYTIQRWLEQVGLLEESPW